MLRNRDTKFLLQRLQRDIGRVAAQRPKRTLWRAAYLRTVIAAMLPASLDDLVSLDNSKPAAIEAANVGAAFATLNYYGDDAAKMGAGLAVTLWLTGARRTTLKVAAGYCRQDSRLDDHLSEFLNPRRVRQFRRDLRI
jgi:hypothetical protein